MAEIFQNEMQITHGDLSKLQIKILRTAVSRILRPYPMLAAYSGA